MLFVAVFAASIAAFAIACAPFSTGTSSSTSTSDASSDGGAKGSFCGDVLATGLLFCDDFDREEDGLDKWSKDNDLATEYALERNSTAASPPFSARCTILPGVDGDDARLRRILPASYSWLEITGVVRVISGDAQPLQLMAFNIADSAALYIVAVNGEVRQRVDGGTSLLAATSLRLDEPPNSLVPFSVTIDLTNRSLAIRVGVNNVQIPIPNAPAPPAKAAVSFGPAERANVGTRWSVLYDNLVVRGR